jgi:hypothetical protein
VLTATDGVVATYAQLHARFKGRLKNGGENDMWTAACALAQPDPVPVVTSNLSDFGTIAGEFPLTLVKTHHRGVTPLLTRRWGDERLAHGRDGPTRSPATGRTASGDLVVIGGRGPRARPR